MISKVHKATYTERSMNRKEIFALNRKHWSRIIQRSDQKQFDIFQNHVSLKSDQANDQGYKAIIDTFLRIKYHVRDIQELISMLDVQNIIDTHQGLIGLNSLGYSIISLDSELDLLGSNIIQILGKIICEHNNTFLRTCSLYILNKIAEKATSQIFPIYFNPTTFPQTVFLHLLNVDNTIIYIQTINLLRKVKNKRYLISAFDDNLHFLHEIQQRIVSEKYDGSKLKRIINFMNWIDVEFWWNRRRFTNKFYQIKNTILNLFVENNEFNQIDQTIRFINKKDQLEKIFVNITPQYHIQLKSVDSFMKKIINLPFQLKFNRKIYCFNSFVENLMSIDRSSAYLSHEQILQYTSQILLEESKSCALESCLLILRKLISNAKENLLNKIFKKEKMFERFRQLYQCWEKKVIRELNRVVCLLIDLCKNYEVLQLLQSYSLVELYFEKCNNFDKLTARCALQEMQWKLNKLRTSDPHLFEVIKKFIMTEKIKSTIQSIKMHNFLAKTRDYCNFFLQMWKPKQIEIQSEKQSQIKILPNNNEGNKQTVIVISDDNDNDDQ